MRMNYLLWSSLRANWPAYFMGACLKVGWWACDSFTRMKMECWDMLTEARANLANTAQPSGRRSNVQTEQQCVVQIGFEVSVVLHSRIVQKTGRTMTYAG